MGEDLHFKLISSDGEFHGTGLENGGQNCWGDCNNQQGKCAWCGTDGWCCRKGWTGNGCDGTYGGDDHHLCVSDHKYCPGSITISFEHDVTYSFDINGYYDSGNNNKVHPAKRSGELTYSHCGGDLLKVELSQGSTSCETGESGAFNGGDTLKWSSTNDKLGACSSTSFNLDQMFLDFKLISSDNNYCPGSITIPFDHDVTYSLGINSYDYDDGNNGKVHSADRRGGSPDIPEFDKENTH